MSTPLEDAHDAYEDAVSARRPHQGRVVALGSSITAEGSMQQRVAHPLLKAMGEAEALADRLRQRVIATHSGHDPKAVVQAKIGLSPSAQLRAKSRGEASWTRP